MSLVHSTGIHKQALKYNSPAINRFLSVRPCGIPYFTFNVHQQILIHVALFKSTFASKTGHNISFLVLDCLNKDGEREGKQFASVQHVSKQIYFVRQEFSNFTRCDMFLTTGNRNFFPETPSTSVLMWSTFTCVFL